MITAQQWCAMVSAWSGKPARIAYRPVAGAGFGNLADTSKRRSLTGPCRTRFESGYQAIFDALRPEAPAGKA